MLPLWPDEIIEVLKKIHFNSVYFTKGLQKQTLFNIFCYNKYYIFMNPEER